MWAAEDTLLGRKVAIKLLSDPYLHDAAAVQRFAREGRAAAQLSSHPNVVTIFDVGQAQGTAEDPQERPFIVMAYLEGGTVGDAIRLGQVAQAQAQALEWVTQAASALDFAHSRGVVHRDIKPSNMLLDGQRVLHVADFGIARVASEDTITTVGHVFGTAAYLSPEQAVGTTATTASDRYSLAVIAYELLSGSRPFAAEHFAAQARQHADEEPAPASSHNPELPREADEVLARGLAKSPQERWSSCSEFAQALTRSLRPAPAVPKSSPALPPTLSLERAAATPRRPPERVPAARPPAERPAAARPPAERPPERPAAARRPPERPPGVPQRHFPRAAALAALAAGAVAVGVAVAAGGGDGTRTNAKLAARPPAHRAPTAVPGAAAPLPTPRAASTQSSSSTASTASATGPSTSASSVLAPAGASPDALQAQGHSLMLGGQYGAAVPILQRAVQTADHSSLTYAYALYDLGHSLRVSGNPQLAVPVLQRRLQIPNQTEIVRQELALAQQANGAGGH